MRLLALCVLLLSFAAFTSATIWYVSPTGLDTAAGTAVATAFRTISKGISMAQAGDTITLLSGTYTESVVTVRAGTSALPITFVSSVRFLRSFLDRASGKD